MAVEAGVVVAAAQMREYGEIAAGGGHQNAGDHGQGASRHDDHAEIVIELTVYTRSS